MSIRKKSEVYTLEASPFYHLGRQVDLVPLTGFPLKTIKRLARERTNHYWRKEQLIGDKLRSIACPIGIMRKLHEQLQSCFNRIEQPYYLYLPRHGHTAGRNARLHEKSNKIAKLDIRQFYPSTTSEHVYRFFFYRLGIIKDVAGLLTKLCTIDGRLPFGSPLSPILCTLVHRDLFDQIALYCQSNSLTMSLWVDDITISGDNISNADLWTIRQMIHVKGLKSHKAQIRHTHLGAIITGHYLHPAGISVANKHHLGVRDSLVQLDSSSALPERLKLLHSLIGKTNYARGIYKSESAIRARLDKRRDWLHAQRRNIQGKTFTTYPIKPIQIPYDNTSLPWAPPTDVIRSLYLSDLIATVPPHQSPDKNTQELREPPTL